MQQLHDSERKKAPACVPMLALSASVIRMVRMESATTKQKLYLKNPSRIEPDGIFTDQEILFNVTKDLMHLLLHGSIILNKRR
jgi:hypothetical protein